MHYRPTHLLRLALRYHSNVKRSRLWSSAASAGAEGIIVLSESCVHRLQQLCPQKDTFLRLAVESGGCSGFQYKFDLDTKLSEDDR